MSRNIQHTLFRYGPLLLPIIWCINTVFFLIRIFIRTKNLNSGIIAIIALHKLGDSVFTIPAITEIQKIENKRIIVVCFPETVPIFRIKLNSVGYLTLDHSMFLVGSRFASSKARKKVAALKPEIIYDLTGVVTSATLIFNSHAAKIIGSNSTFFKHIYDNYSPVRKEPHLMNKYLDAVLQEKKENYKKDILIFERQNAKNQKILIQPFAGWKAKEWGLSNFIELATRLNKNYTVFMIMPEWLENRDITKELKSNKINIKLTNSINELIDCIREAFVFVGNDSGPVYIAGLMGIPTFAIFGPTNPDYSSLFGNHHWYINKTLTCSPSASNQYCITNAGRMGCPSYLCMNLLGVDEVYNCINSFLTSISN